MYPTEQRNAFSCTIVTFGELAYITCKTLRGLFHSCKPKVGFLQTCVSLNSELRQLTCTVFVTISEIGHYMAITWPADPM